MVEVKRIKYLSHEYKQALSLRDEILRKPLGRTIYDENLKSEADDKHFVAIVDNIVRGVLILTKLSDENLQMRQVAVEAKMQGQGIGKSMIIHAENYAKNRGYKKIVLHARKPVVEFYKQLSYEVVSEEFIEIGISHFKMQKRI